MAIDCTSPVTTLGDFIHCVSEMRKTWGLPKHKELWFRGESKDFEDTILRPELHRPARGDNGKGLPRAERMWNSALNGVQTGRFYRN